jgi:hypothetical protein
MFCLPKILKSEVSITFQNHDNHVDMTEYQQNYKNLHRLHYHPEMSML